MNKVYDFCILGAGLAGVSLASELLRRNASVCLIDHNEPASGASGTPLGLVNPATGRYATKTWRAESCYNAILSNLEKVQSKTPVQFFRKSGVLRPALSSKIASRMIENVSGSDWPDKWCEWLDEETLKDFHPGISCNGGGVWLPIGLTVDISTFLRSFVQILEQDGLSTFFNTDYSIQKNINTDFTISISDSENITAGALISACGHKTSELKPWKELNLHSVKGQLAILESDKPINFTHAVSALGYITSLSPNRFVAGSTYEHKFEHEDTDKSELDYLMSRFEKVLPELKRNSTVKKMWAGVRASTPNRKPYLGEHPDETGNFIFTGLGSKGLLYSAYLSEIFADYLIDGKSLPAEIDVKRAYK